MNCRDFENAWIDAGMKRTGLFSGALEHLEGCGTCRRMVDDEERVDVLLDSLPRDDIDLAPEIFAAVERGERTRRLLSVLPVLTSAGVFFGGVISWGGIPAGHLLADFPGHALEAGGDVSSSLAGWLVEAARAAGSLSQVIPGFLAMLAAVLSLGGLAASLGIYRGWKQRWASRF